MKAMLAQGYVPGPVDNDAPGDVQCECGTTVNWRGCRGYCPKCARIFRETVVVKPNG